MFCGPNKFVIPHHHMLLQNFHRRHVSIGYTQKSAGDIFWFLIRLICITPKSMQRVKKDDFVIEPTNQSSRDYLLCNA